MKLITTLHEACCRHTHDRTLIFSPNDFYGMEVSWFDETINKVQNNNENPNDFKKKNKSTENNAPI